jgi:Lar family restriction alleviation protein
MSDDLKPCPFCGEAQPPHDDTSWVRCLGCGAETGWRPTGDEAIAAWNTRAPDPSIEDLTEQLEAARADTKKAEAYAEELEAKNGNLCDLAANEHGRAERAEAKLAKAVKALLLARVHVANNGQGWSVGRASARSDLKIINATLAEIEGEKT